jgi:hypothetical protein
MGELRTQSHGDPQRVFQAVDPSRSALLLIGGNKTAKNKRCDKTMIPKADALYDEYLNTLQFHLKRGCGIASLRRRNSGMSLGFGPHVAGADASCFTAGLRSTTAVLRSGAGDGSGGLSCSPAAPDGLSIGCSMAEPAAQMQP